MHKEGNHYTIPVRINDTVTLPFLIDTGADNVAIPTDVVLTLLRAGTIKSSDFVGTGTALLADGTKVPSPRFILHKLQVGNQVITDIVGTIINAKGDPLLGQSFLAKLPSWTVDNQQHVLILQDRDKTAKATTTAVPHLSPPSPDETGLSSPERRTDTGDRVAALLSRAHQAFVSHDYYSLMKWCRIAAADGNAACMRSIGSMYLEGAGVVRDYREAVRWNLRAAEYGDAIAQSNVGFLYMNGLGVQRDDGEALRWLSLGASQGNADAANNIGWMTAQGLGVRQDCAIAKGWFQWAAAAGDKTARENIANGARGACRW